ncbi:Gfo/Idh/MocA family oxidoreductase [Orbaceae bacterium ac157xtp]
MIRLAVIGTNWITDKFVTAALETGKYSLQAVYSRSLDNAKQFGEKYKVPYFYSSIEELASSNHVDAVYIASPNSLHFSQAKLMLAHGKHVICEKPLCSNTKQAKELIEFAKKQKCVLFEAFKTAYIPNFNQIRQYLPKLGKLRKVFFNYCQFSSRYPRYLAGENPNTFNPQFSNGSVVDIGVYSIASAVALWGKPNSILASASKLASGVDAHGSVIMNYGDFDVVVFHSKVSDSKIPSEIQGENGTLVIDQLSICHSINYVERGLKAEAVNVTLSQNENEMFYEAMNFANLIKTKQFDHSDLLNSLITAEVLTEIRRQTNVVFPVDEE